MPLGLPAWLWHARGNCGEELTSCQSFTSAASTCKCAPVSISRIERRVSIVFLEVGRGDATALARGLVLRVFVPLLYQLFAVGWEGAQTAPRALLRLLHTLTCEYVLARWRWEGEKTLAGLCSAFFILSPPFPSSSPWAGKGCKQLYVRSCVYCKH